MRRFGAAAAGLMLAAGAGQAQTGPSFAEFFHPDRIARVAVQAGVSVLRSQFALAYEGLSVDFMGGRITLSGVVARPEMPWPDGSSCEIAIARLTLTGSPWDVLDRSRFRIDVNGLEAPLACLPEDARVGFAMAGLAGIAIPQLTLSGEFDVNSGAAALGLVAGMDGFATVSIDADFAYLAFESGMGGAEEAPGLRAELRSARLTVEDRGAWSVFGALMPEPMTALQSGGPMLGMALGGALTGMTDPGQVMDPVAEDALNALIASVSDAWTAFLRSPEQLVVETGFPQDQPVALDLERYGSEPTAMVADLQPVVATAPRSAMDLLPAALVAAATGSGADTLSVEDRRRAGMALLTGEGAPVDLATALMLLEPIAQSGDAEAALAIARATAGSAPEAAYGWALIAGAAGVPGAVAVLDGIEDRLPLRDVLDLQAAAAGGDPLLPGRVSVGSLRQAALDSLSGGGGTGRSYERALFWATLGQAAGDATSENIVQQIHDLARLADPEDMEAWGETSARISRQALEFWLTNDLPSRLALRD